MNNFGVIEVASTRTTHAPGWAYVPDTSINPALAAAQQQGPANRKKRARNQPNVGLSDLSARQEAKLRKQLEAFDRDSHARDAQIAIPSKPGGGGGGGSRGKHTPNVRKILTSQKTFANHLDDFEALHHDAPPSKADVEMADAPSAEAADTPSKILTPYEAPNPMPPHPRDGDPLLASRVPPLPSDAELAALMAHPPLSYSRARATWGEEDKSRYPVRVFCEVCGYWGRVGCLKCGARVCALDCLNLHRQECVTRYGL